MSIVARKHIIPSRIIALYPRAGRPAHRDAAASPDSAPRTAHLSPKGLKIKVLAKKEEASAGSGGTAIHALAGGGNQSLLTATAVCLGERRAPQSSIGTHPMPTVFLAPRKKNRKSRRPSFPASPPRVKTRPEPRHCRSTTGLAARFRPGWAVVALTLICLLYTSDAADDLLCVDLGGRRIIKKKKKQRQNTVNRHYTATITQRTRTTIQRCSPCIASVRTSTI